MYYEIISIYKDEYLQRNEHAIISSLSGIDLCTLDSILDVHWHISSIHICINSIRSITRQ